MKKQSILILISLVFILTPSSYVSAAHMNSIKMNKLELGMSKDQVTDILGKDYTIAEKYINKLNDVYETVEILSYRDHFNNDEFYMYVFRNNKLEKWYRILQPKVVNEVKQ